MAIRSRDGVVQPQAQMKRKVRSRKTSQSVVKKLKIDCERWKTRQIPPPQPPTLVGDCGTGPPPVGARARHRHARQVKVATSFRMRGVPQSVAFRVTSYTHPESPDPRSPNRLTQNHDDLPGSDRFVAFVPLVALPLGSGTSLRSCSHLAAVPVGKRAVRQLTGAAAPRYPGDLPMPSNPSPASIVSNPAARQAAPSALATSCTHASMRGSSTRCARAFRFHQHQAG